MTEQSSSTTSATSTAIPQEGLTQEINKEIHKKGQSSELTQRIFILIVALFLVLFTLYYQSQLSPLKNELSPLKNELSSLKNQLSSLKEEAADLKKQTSDLKVEIADLEHVSASEANLNVDLVQRVEKLEKNFVDQVNKVKQLGKKKMATQKKKKEKSTSRKFFHDNDDFLPF